MTIQLTPVEEDSHAGAADIEVLRWLLGILRQSHSEWLNARVEDLERLPHGGQPQEQQEWVARALYEGSGRPDAVAHALDRELSAFRNRSLTGESHPCLWLRGVRATGAHGHGEHGVAVGMAIGIDSSGARTILGICSLGASTGKTWSHFLDDLVGRGLSGVRVVVLDPRPGLSGAVARVLPHAVVRRSREATLRDVLAAVPAAEQRLVTILLNSLYMQASAHDARVQHRRVVDQLAERYPEAAQRLNDAADDFLGSTEIPEAHWHRMLSALDADPATADSVRVTSLQSNFFVVAPSGNRHAGVAPRAPSSVIQGEATPVKAQDGPVRSTWSRWSPPKLGIARLGNILALPAAAASRNTEAPATRAAVWTTVLLVGPVVLATVLAHAVNVFNFPRYELDEGTYMSSAWAVLNDQITAYPYGYGHPPLGWIQIAIWTTLTGGFFTFGNALNTGRVLMVLFDAGSSLLVYLIAARVSGRRAIGLLAMVIFSFSPLSLLYQRQVFLDNIAVFWLLLSVFLVMISRSRMRYLIGAGLAFGCALLSKETIALFIPVIVYGLWLNLSRYQRVFGMVTFTYTVLALGFSLVLLALIKGELFPYAWHLPWDHHPHLSLLDTLAVQVRRSQSEGSLAQAWSHFWINGDPWLMVLSIAATIFNLLVGIWRRDRLFFALAAVSYWLLLLRGGVVLPFYVILLIPLAALNAALAADTLLSLVRRFRHAELVSAALVACLPVAFLANDAVRADPIFTQHPTAAQSQAVVWIRDNVPQQSVVVVNSYLYMDLRQPGGEGVGAAATYPYAHVYWNVAYDPELHDGLLQGNWDRIDYIVADSEMLHDITTLGGQMAVLEDAMKHSVLREEFRVQDNERLDMNAPAADQQIVISVYQVMHKLPPPTPFNRT